MSDQAIPLLVAEVPRSPDREREHKDGSLVPAGPSETVAALCCYYHGIEWHTVTETAVRHSR